MIHSRVIGIDLGATNIRAAVVGHDYVSNIHSSRIISAGSMKVLLTWILKTPTTYIEEEGTTIASFLTSLHFPYLIEENPQRL